MLGVCELQSIVDVGMSCNKIAFSELTQKWCIYGEVGNGL